MSKKTKKHYNKPLKKIALIIVLILIIYVLFTKINNKIEKINYEKIQIILNNENITEKLKNEIVEQDTQIYMSIEDIQKFLDKTIYTEEENETIITTSNKKLATMSEENKEYILINGSKQLVKNPVIKKDEKIYIAISSMENIYNYKFNYIESNKIITIDSLNKKSIKAYVKKDTILKKENKKFSNSIEKIKKGTWVTYIDEEANKARIRTESGNIGYISKKALDNFVTEREDYNEKENKKTENFDFEYDITNKDITTFEKREEIINSILQEMIKNDKMNLKILYNGERNFNFERFKIESTPILAECGIAIYF